MTTPRRKACVECRQQKIRCDVEQIKVPPDPCSRCKKMGLECRILPTSTRNLRQTKADMRRELEELRWNMRGDGTHHPNQFATPNSSMGGVGGVDYSPYEGPSGSFTGGSVTGSSLSPSYENGGGVSRPVSRKGSGPSSQTLPRVLDGYFVDAKRIEDCFTLFFTQYHAILPILDPTLTPNDYYDTSPFLFWSIIVTGSRRYTNDPTILDKTSQLIAPLAFSSMALRSTPIPVIQGLLILCTWRLPTNSMYKDMTHVLCGAAIHLATQIGLHVAGVGQDFARMPIKKDQHQKIFRAKLWMQCVIVSIRSSCTEGIPPLVIAETFFDSDEKDRQEAISLVEPNLQFLHRVHIILLRAECAMVRTDLKSTNCDVGVLRSLISIFDSQLLSIAPSSPSELDTFQMNCARIHILCYHFFANSADLGPDAESLARLYNLCVSTIQTANTLVQNTNFATVCPSFIDRTLTLTGFAILKIIRSPIGEHLDQAAGQAAYFSAVQFSKMMSLQNNDLGARAAAIMTNLWSSTKTFKRKDGSLDSLGLRLRTRLSMSVSFDMFWYWREEFGHMSNPYNGDESVHLSNAATQPATPDYEKENLPEPTDQTNAPKTTAPTLTHPQSQAAAPVAAPSTKYQPDALMNPNQPIVQPPVGMSFDIWDGTDYNVPPMLDQFPDYDWAASFDFSTDWPNATLNTGPTAPLPNNNAFGFPQNQNEGFA
ncbi:C6 zinc finger domain-containing protein [Lophiotrema nucula]|uniref:C6 zinc finger domain-containing protein n=1 Tax=Lophiotrema nucula TaxID=690887 RepID=A0A6A5ZU22_9PLEO|nr:C6 zinc finger domain-containing protein [Lophiotrema nucula]